MGYLIIFVLWLLFVYVVIVSSIITKKINSATKELHVYIKKLPALDMEINTITASLERLHKVRRESSDAGVRYCDECIIKNKKVLNEKLKLKNRLAGIYKKEKEEVDNLLSSKILLNPFKKIKWTTKY